MGNRHVERMDLAQVNQGTMSVHLARYHFAAPFCAGKKILDVACGGGYGTSLLSKTAIEACGVDIDEETVAYAIKHFESANARFQAGDATQLPFGDSCFDTVVSFETIEHMDDAARYLKEMRRVLRTDGVYIVSTPKSVRTNPKPANPFHRVEYSLADFRSLLERYFVRVELYGQSTTGKSAAHRWLARLDCLRLRRLLPTDVKSRATKVVGSTPFEEMGLDDQKITKNEFAAARTMIAVCRG